MYVWLHKLNCCVYTLPHHFEDQTSNPPADCFFRFSPASPNQLSPSMSDPKAPAIAKRDTPSWALYQRENFWKLNDGITPPFNTGSFNLPSEKQFLICIQNLVNSRSSRKKNSLRTAGGCPVSSSARGGGLVKSLAGLHTTRTIPAQQHHLADKLQVLC